MNSCTSLHEVLWTYCLGEGLSGILGGAILVKVRCVLFFFFTFYFSPWTDVHDAWAHRLQHMLCSMA